MKIKKTNKDDVKKESINIVKYTLTEKNEKCLAVQVTSQFLKKNKMKENRKEENSTTVIMDIQTGFLDIEIDYKKDFT